MTCYECHNATCQCIAHGGFARHLSHEPVYSTILASRHYAPPPPPRTTTRGGVTTAEVELMQGERRADGLWYLGGMTRGLPDRVGTREVVAMGRRATARGDWYYVVETRCDCGIKSWVKPDTYLIAKCPRCRPRTKAEREKHIGVGRGSKEFTDRRIAAMRAQRDEDAAVPFWGVGY